MQAGNSPGDVPLLFFSRQIGISQGQAVPVRGGARLTGKVGKNNIAIMDVQTDSAFDKPGDNFFVGRYSHGISFCTQLQDVFT